MFGLFKSDSDVLAEALYQMGWGVEIGPNETRAVEASGVNMGVYTTEVICLQLFSTLCGYLDWEGRESISEQTQQEAMNKFYAKLEKTVVSTWPNIPNLYVFIRQHILKYHAAHNKDLEAAAAGAVSAYLPGQFVEYLASACGGEVPLELMEGASARFHTHFKGTQEVLSELRRFRK